MMGGEDRKCTSLRISLYNRLVWHFSPPDPYIHQSVHSSVSPYIHQSVHSSVRTFISLYIHQFVHSSVRTFISPYIHQSIHSSVHTFISPYHLPKHVPELDFTLTLFTYMVIFFTSPSSRGFYYLEYVLYSIATQPRNQLLTASFKTQSSHFRCRTHKRYVIILNIQIANINFSISVFLW